VVSEAIPRPLAWAGIEARLWSWGTGRGHGGISHNPVGVESVAPGKPKVARASQPLGCEPKSLWDLKAARGAAMVAGASGFKSECEPRRGAIAVCAFPEDAGPTGLKLSIGLGVLQ